jgi:hypothetical protein
LTEGERLYRRVSSDTFEVSGSYLRRFLFHTWLGAGPPAAFFNPVGMAIEEESFSPLVVFATKRGRVLGCGEALAGAVDVVAKLQSVTIAGKFVL